jgi:hypothetical protein
MSDEYVVTCDCKGIANRRIIALIDDHRPVGPIHIPWCQPIEAGGSVGGTLVTPNKRGGRRSKRFGVSRLRDGHQLGRADTERGRRYLGRAGNGADGPHPLAADLPVGWWGPPQPPVGLGVRRGLPWRWL